MEAKIREKLGVATSSGVTRIFTAFLLNLFSKVTSNVEKDDFKTSGSFIFILSQWQALGAT